MRIRRVILRDVNNFKAFDRSFEDEWTGRVPQALLLMGPNGSGKTTLLYTIAQVWSIFPRILDLTWNEQQGFEKPAASPWIPPGLHDRDVWLSPLWASSLAAVEILDLEDRPLWIAHVSSADNLQEAAFIHERDAYRVGIVWTAGQSTYRWFYMPPGTIMPRPDETRQTEWASHWKQRFSENVFGKVADLPNIVYLQSELRYLPAVAEPFTPQPEPEEYRWLATYTPTDRRKGSLQNYLYHLKVVDEEQFDNIVEQVNRFLAGKRLAGFDRRTGDLMVEVEGGASHPLHLLSGGEKQVLLMIAMITRWLRPGGVVLIDEPDLHLHVSQITAMVNHLQRMIAEKDGQLIIASHEPPLWKQFTDSRTVRLGNLA